MKEERIKILQMIANGQISAEEGAKLLQAMEMSGGAKGQEQGPGGPGRSQARWFRVRVTDLRTGQQKTSVNIPLSLVTIGIRLGARFAPEMIGVDAERVVQAIRRGQVGKIFEASDEAEGERIEVYVE